MRTAARPGDAGPCVYLVLALGVVLYLGPFAHPGRDVVQDRCRRRRQPDVADPRPRRRSTPGARCWATTRPSTRPILRWLGNSFLVTTSVTLGRVFLASLAGYALARLRFPGRRGVAGLIAVLAVPGIVLLIPKFLVLQNSACSTPTAG